MGVRETLTKSKPLGIGLACVMIVGGAVAIYVQAGGGATAAAGQIFVTDDDGKTFEPGAAARLLTVGKSGKPVARAHVFECGGKRVVGYTSRYTEEALKLVAEAKAAQAEGKVPENVGRLSSVMQAGLEYKRLDATAWVSQRDSVAVGKIRQFTCPDGNMPAEVLP